MAVAELLLLAVNQLIENPAWAIGDLSGGLSLVHEDPAPGTGGFVLIGFTGRLGARPRSPLRRVATRRYRDFKQATPVDSVWRLF